MMSKGMIKVICIIMAVLMILGVGAVVLQVFAVDENAIMTFVNPATGDNGSDYYVPAGIAVAAILAVVLCVVLPKLKKKDVSAQMPESKAKPSQTKSTQQKSAPTKVTEPKIRTVGRNVSRKDNKE